MNSTHSVFVTIIALMAGPAAYGQIAPPPGGSGIDPDDVIVYYPSPAFGDIQAAIDAVPDQGRLIIGPGRFDVPEPLMISKQITIQGAGCRATSALDIADSSPRKLVAAVKEANSSDLPYTRLVGPRPSDVVAPDESTGLFSFVGRKAGGAVIGLEIVGQNAGIFINDAPLPGDIGGEPGADEAPQPGLKITKSCIIGSSRGIHARTNSHVDVSRVIVWDPLHNGISFSISSGEPVRPASLTLSTALIYRPRNGCIYQNGGVLVILDTPLIGCGPHGAVFANNNSTVIIARSNFVQLAGPGITLLDSQGYVHSSQIRDAKGQGIFMDQSALQMKDSRILETKPRPSDGFYGDGIDAINNSTADLDRNLIKDTSRTGIANFGSTVRLADNTVQCALFEFQEEVHPLLSPIYSPTWVDDGGNLCGCPTANQNCIKVSGGGAGAPPPVGGLE